MFGCVVAGRPLQTNLQQVDQTHAYFELPNASAINHVCVFLLGTVPFPEGYGATVHFFWPGKGFQLLGMLSNEKPSAMFRLRGAYIQPSSSAAHNTFSSRQLSETNPDEVTALVGLAIEPQISIQDQLAHLPSHTSTLAKLAPASALQDPIVLAERIVKHLFNFISGFIGGSGGVTPELAVPMNLIVRWYDGFVGKVKAAGSGFLENVE